MFRENDALSQGIVHVCRGQIPFRRLNSLSRPRFRRRSTVTAPKTRGLRTIPTRYLAMHSPSERLQQCVAGRVPTGHAALVACGNPRWVGSKGRRLEMRHFTTSKAWSRQRSRATSRYWASTISKGPPGKACRAIQGFRSGYSCIMTALLSEPRSRASITLPDSRMGEFSNRARA